MRYHLHIAHQNFTTDFFGTFSECAEIAGRYEEVSSARIYITPYTPQPGDDL